MKSKDRIRVLLGLLVIFMLPSFIPNITGVEKNVTISTIAEKDSYVLKNYPDSNNGGKSYLIFGNQFGWNEAYLHFNFSGKPTGWTKAEISIDIYYISETFNVTVSLITDSWDELTINWANKPNHGEVITTFTVATNKIYKVDVTEYIAGRDNISICLYASDYLQGGYVQARSQEGRSSSSPEKNPQLIWTYPDDVTITITNPTSSTSWYDIDTFYNKMDNIHRHNY